MLYTKDSYKLILALAAAAWSASVFMSFAIHVLSEQDFLPSFVKMFVLCAIITSGIILIKRGLFHSVLLSCGHIIMFSLTVLGWSAING